MNVPREHIQQFLCSIGHEPASKDQASLCLVEDVVRALGEVTEEMIEAAHDLDEDLVVSPIHDRLALLKRGGETLVWQAMFEAKLPPHVPKDE